MISASGRYVDGILVVPGAPPRDSVERRHRPSRHGLEKLAPAESAFFPWAGGSPERLRWGMRKHVQRLHRLTPGVVYRVERLPTGLQVTREA